MSEQAGRYQRSMAGMVAALLVLVALVIGFVMLRDLDRKDPESPVRAVDYRQSLPFAREHAGFRVLAPHRLPKGWEATTVTFTRDPARWHLGVLTGQEHYIGLEQAVATQKSMVKEYVDPAAAPGKDLTIDDQTWHSWSDSGGDTALVRADGKATTLVVGTVDQGVLVDYVQSLR